MDLQSNYQRKSYRRHLSQQSRKRSSDRKSMRGSNLLRKQRALDISLNKSISTERHSIKKSSVKEMEEEMDFQTSGGEKELHPFIRPGLCTIIIALTVLLCAFILFNMSTEVLGSACTRLAIPLSWCKSLTEKQTQFGLYLIIVSGGIFLVGLVLTIWAGIYLIRNSTFAKKSLKERYLTRLMECSKEAIWENETLDAGSQRVVANLKRPGFWWWVRNIDRKMINQAVYLDISDEASQQREIQVRELYTSKRTSPNISRQSSVRSEKSTDELPKEQKELQVAESLYFKLPFEYRLKLEEMVRAVALDGLDSNQKTVSRHCRCWNDKAEFVSTFDIDQLYTSVQKPK